MTTASNLTVFQPALREDGIAVVTIDLPGESQNTLKAEFVDEANALLDRLEQDPNVRGVVLISGKPGSFIAGADINMLKACRTAAEAAELSKAGQRFFDRLENFKTPVVAAIDGACLGGGLELALACHGRVCTDHPKTALGLPEVMLGVLPGSGGTQRLPRLIGIPAALDLMLTGKHLNAQKARRLGLVDEVAPATILLANRHRTGAETPAPPRRHPQDRQPALGQGPDQAGAGGQSAGPAGPVPESPRAGTGQDQGQLSRAVADHRLRGNRRRPGLQERVWRAEAVGFGELAVDAPGAAVDESVLRHHGDEKGHRRCRRQRSTPSDPQNRAYSAPG